MANTTEKPIVFSTPMVKAILEGRKAMTRRVIKPQPYLNDVGRLAWIISGWTTPEEIAEKAPYHVGHKLWVRETWRVHHGDEGTQCLEYKADAADNLMPHWKPSIFMPRWASRITLEVTGLKVERVQDITESDVVAEGIQDTGAGDLRAMFAVLWSSINAKRGYGWAVNPWVWCISFKREQNG